jgi:two-component system, response regulator PdtaR
VALVVEDHHLIRKGLAETLQDAGCEVIEAADAAEALLQVARRCDIKAVLADVVMPGSFDGLELARQVHSGWPAIHLILTSWRPIADLGPMPPDTWFVPKPYDARVFPNRLSAMLN